MNIHLQKIYEGNKSLSFSVIGLQTFAMQKSLTGNNFAMGDKGLNKNNVLYLFNFKVDSTTLT